MLVFSIILDAAGQTWPPFVLVAGLLLIGQAASAEGLFEALAARIACAPLPPRVLLVALLALVAVVTALLNLDTSVVFLTPVLVHAARRRTNMRNFKAATPGALILCPTRELAQQVAHDAIDLVQPSRGELHPRGCPRASSHSQRRRRCPPRDRLQLGR